MNISLTHYIYLVTQRVIVPKLCKWFMVIQGVTVIYSRNSFESIIAFLPSIFFLEDNGYDRVERAVCGEVGGFTGG